MGRLTLRESRPLGQIFEYSVDKFPDNIAIECAGTALSYRQLDIKVNQLAQYLMSVGIRQGSHVGILLERTMDSYIAILAVLKTGAAYVPIDIEYPDERINFILSDLSFDCVVTCSSQLIRDDIQFPMTVVVDKLRDELSKQSNLRPQITFAHDNHLCYVIYTSGTSGKPKGVEITHHNVSHYVSVASQLYEIKPNDRIYQGFSLAFDASIEELWMAFANGATLVACPSKDIRSGIGLIEFLKENRVTIFSTVPTLLCSLEDDALTSLRLLILGGETCLPHLIKRFSRQGLRIVNTYGPTEATVIATYSECQPDKPITIGKPLPGYQVMILDEQLQPVVDGQVGELFIGGLGIARGYVNRPDMNAIKFINHSEYSRLYRTGDLASIDMDGNFVYLGRVDDQVKIRGFRVELNEIESVMLEHRGVLGAIVSLQDDGNTPMLVSHLMVDQQGSFDLLAFKDSLRQKLPHFMIPSLYELMDVFPLLSSGKVDRRALPKLEHSDLNLDYVAPKTKSEQLIAEIVAKVLQVKQVSLNADFFYDLGGHSLLAAKVISLLRKVPEFCSISIIDLYHYPTVGLLADKFSTNPVDSNHQKNKDHKHYASSLSYISCGIGQFFGCLLQYAIETWQLLLIVFCYQFFNLDHDSDFSKSTLILLGLAFGLPILTIMFTVSAKWILLGRVKPGRYKLWGWFYFRWWLVDRLHHYIFPSSHLIGTPLINLYYRLMGAKIGSHCYIGTASIASFDTLTIGDNSSIGYDARLLGFQVEDGWLKIGAINIGQDCFIGARSVISQDVMLHDRVVLDNMTMVPTSTVIPSDQFICGSPARQSVPPSAHITNSNEACHQSSLKNTIVFGMLHYLSFVLIGLLHYASFIPGLSLMAYVYHQTDSFVAVLMIAPIAASMSMMLYYCGVIFLKRILMNKIKQGIHLVNSLYYLRQLMVVKLIDTDEISVLADSLFFPPLLRFLGAKLGKWVEMGETPHIIPDLITLDEEAFTASGVAMAWPNIYHGRVQVAPVHVGKRAFSGNLSLLPSGTRLGDSGLLGCLTIPPSNGHAAKKHTSWLGSPPMFLPKRELFNGFSDKDTVNPSPRLFFSRLFLELIRVLLPTSFNLIGFFGLLLIMNHAINHYSWAYVMAILPLAELGIVLSLVAAIVSLKWAVQGRLKPTIKPLWDIFIRKIDLIEFSWGYFINPRFTDVILGTPFMSMLLRSLGVSIGKKVYIGSPNFAEFDLITIGDHVCINSDTLIDTHLYEDRIFKTSTIDIHDDCNIGSASIILYDTVMEQNSNLGNMSLLMKGEHLPSNTSWQGIPAQSMQETPFLAVVTSESYLDSKDQQEVLIV